MLLLKSLTIWFALLVTAIANGALRDGVLVKLLARAADFVCGGLLLIGGESV
jgi:hypothetical protein